MIYILDTGFNGLELEYKSQNADTNSGIHGYTLHTLASSINPDTMISCYDLGGSPSNQDIIDALEYVEKVSDGGIVCITLTINKSVEVESVIHRMMENDKFIFIVAGGNQAVDINLYTPSSTSGVISVGSLNKANEIASHNNIGELGLYAPGTNIDVNGGKHSGTSIATAIVAGFWSKFWNFDDVKYNLSASFDSIIHHKFSPQTKYVHTNAIGGDANGARNAIHVMRGEIDEISSSYCLAKWLQVTLHLQNGRTHSCHHPGTHHVPLEELKNNPSALHNTEFKKEQRQKMLDGERPDECQYCWNVEDLPGEHISDRYWKSLDNNWSLPYKKRALDAGATGNVNPSYVEVSFSNACNFKCSYCSPVHSSKWVSEIRKEGPYELTGRKHNNLDWYVQNSEMPIHHKEENPYVDAFWEWWPDLSKDLKVFRITGGEPLIEKNTFKVLESLKENPQPNMQVDINSNCCIPEEGLTRYIDLMRDLLSNRKISSSTLYTSVDGHGKAAEYGRPGLDYDVWLNTVDRVLTELPELTVTIMCTTNIFSITSFEKLLEDVLMLRKKHMNVVRKKPILLDMSILRWPGHQCAAILPNEYASFMHGVLKYMVDNQERTGEIPPYEGFFDFEISKMERFIEFISQPPHEAEGVHVPTMRKDFYLFVNEHDRRRGTNFLETFPDLEDFYRMCEEENNKRII